MYNKLEVFGSVPLSLTKQSAKDFSIYSVVLPLTSKGALPHNLRERDIREIWQSAKSLEDALSQRKSHTLSVCSGTELCKDSIKYPELLTFNNLIDFFKCLLNVSLFKFFFRA